MLYAVVPLVGKLDGKERGTYAGDAVGMREFRRVQRDRERLIRNRAIGVGFVILPFHEKAKIWLRVGVHGQIVRVVVAHDRHRRAADNGAPHDGTVKFAFAQPFDLAVHGYSITHRAAAVTGRCGERVYSM